MRTFFSNLANEAKTAEANATKALGSSAYRRVHASLAHRRGWVSCPRGCWLRGWQRAGSSTEQDAAPPKRAAEANPAAPRLAALVLALATSAHNHAVVGWFPNRFLQ